MTIELPRTALHWILGAAAGGAIAFFLVGLTSYFERKDTKPFWIRLAHHSGQALTLGHFASVLIVKPRSDAFAVAGIVMYTTAVAVMLASIEAADRTRLQRSFVDHPLPERLITEGPYHWVRHPFYLSYMLGALAPAVAVQNPFVIAISLMMISMVAAAAVREERVWLASPKADAYREYQRHTGMFLPFIGRR